MFDCKCVSSISVIKFKLDGFEIIVVVTHCAVTLKRSVKNFLWGEPERIFSREKL